MTERRPDASEPTPAGHVFRHEALLYAGHRQFVDSVVPFLREGLAAGETTAALLEADKIALLREALGEDADRVRFTDAAQVGRNPARLIPWWRRFVDEHLSADRPVRAVEEPSLTGRRPAELDEYLAHEALLNVAFADNPPWSLLCPQDVTAVTPEVVEEFRRNHPFAIDKGRRRPNSDYRAAAAPGRLDQPLTAPPVDARQIRFGAERSALRSIRSAVLEHADRSGLDATAAGHLVLAVNELASNSLQHGGGNGTIRLWRDGEVAVCEVSDTGRLTGPPLLGRELPTLDRPGGRGLWLVNQLCDLVQVRTSSAGTTVRLHMWPTA
jgi:anti-sigma regulatory factor (Ser/Thr protein kinase)